LLVWIDSFLICLEIAVSGIWSTLSWINPRSSSLGGLSAVFAMSVDIARTFSISGTDDMDENLDKCNPAVCINPLIAF